MGSAVPGVPLWLLWPSRLGQRLSEGAEEGSGGDARGEHRLVLNGYVCVDLTGPAVAPHSAAHRVHPPPGVSLGARVYHFSRMHSLPPSSPPPCPGVTACACSDH